VHCAIPSTPILSEGTNLGEQVGVGHGSSEKAARRQKVTRALLSFFPIFSILSFILLFTPILDLLFEVYFVQTIHLVYKIVKL